MDDDWWDAPMPFDVAVDGVVRQMFGTYRGAMEFFRSLPLPYREAAVLDGNGQVMILKFGHPIQVRNATAGTE